MARNTVLVTGATGLLGREVARAFRLSGWTVKGTALSRADGVDVYKADVQKANEIARVLEETKSVPSPRSLASAANVVERQAPSLTAEMMPPWHNQPQRHCPL